MSIERGDFDAISEQDLQELVTAQVPEGLRLEYKRAAYGNSDAEKREFLKDVSALANTQGGHLILGIEAASGVATAIAGLGDTDFDAELVRMEQIARAGLEPRISGLRMRAVPLAERGHAIVIRVPRSWNPPHRVVSQGSNRFYVRHSAGVHEPNVQELRMLFTQTTSALEDARQFRDERVEFIRSGVGECPLFGEGRFILHIVPVASFSGALTLDLELVHEHRDAFHPMGHASMAPRFNYYGFIYEKHRGENFGYTQVFRNGMLEVTQSELVSEREKRRLISGVHLERDIFDVLSDCIGGLRDVGVPPPLIIMFTLEGVLGAEYILREDIRRGLKSPFPEDTIFLPECILEDYGEELDYHKAVRPAFDALWNAAGYSHSEFFNDVGQWVGPPTGGRRVTVSRVPRR